MATKKTSEDQDFRPSADQTCYLVLHGEIAIFDDGGDGDFPISIYTPQMQEHVYMAGPWLGEERIPQGTSLQLMGVESGEDYIEDHADKFLVFQGAEPEPSSTYLQIYLPRPYKITPVRLNALTANSVKLFGPSNVSVVLPEGGSFPPNISKCTVFEYQLSSTSAPEFSLVSSPAMAFDSDWSAGQNSSTGAFSLHLYAESDAEETDPHHAEESFFQSAKILGANVQLFASQNKNGPPTDVPAYLAQEEVSYTLAERIIEMRKLTSGDRSHLDRLPRFTLPKRVGIFNDLFTCGSLAMIASD